MDNRTVEAMLVAAMDVYDEHELDDAGRCTNPTCRANAEDEPCLAGGAANAVLIAWAAQPYMTVAPR